MISNEKKKKRLNGKNRQAIKRTDLLERNLEKKKKTLRNTVKQETVKEVGVDPV